MPRLTGGDGAAEYGVKAYGGVNDQHAQPGGGNFIAMKVGGRRKRKSMSNLFSSFTMGVFKKSRKHRKSHKNRKSRRSRRR